jgi:ATP-binding cassette subfamily F protein 3
MLTLSNISKGYAGKQLFQDASLVLNRGECLGLIGRNGHGKSTLLRLICGKEDLDQGQISVEKGCRIGILEQYFQFTGETTLAEAEKALPLLDGAYRETFKAEQVLEGLGFSEERRQQAPETLSGGYQIRLNLAKLLLSEPDILLLDEPTNYLDIVSVKWLETFLKEWKGGSIVISHNRSFIDSISSHIALIYRMGIRKLSGTTEKIYGRIAEEEEIHEKTRLHQAKERERQEEFIRKYRSKARQASRVQSRVKALERTEVIEKLETEKDLAFQFSYEAFSPKWILHAKELCFGYEEFPLFQDLSFSLGTNDRIGIIGANGKGKSTLLSLLYGALTPRSGSTEIHSLATVGYLGQSNIERLHPDKTVEELILEKESNHNRTRARTIAGCMLFSGDTAEKQSKVLSGGEKTRVHLGRIIAQPTNLLFLDEPTNHLDYYASQALLNALEDYVGAVVLVTHDEEFLRKIANRLIIFQQGGATLFEGGYTDFLHRGGWEEQRNTSLESASMKSSTIQSSTLNKKELRKQRSEILKEKGSVLKPLKSEMKKTEQTIEAHEQAISEEEQELIEITVNGFNDRAAKLSRSIASRRQQIEELFEALEQLESEIVEHEATFEEKLKAFN